MTSSWGRRAFSPARTPGPATAIAYVASFAAAKLAIFAAPIALAAVATAQVYGGIEVAHALALLLATLWVSAPVHGLSHRFILHGEPRFRKQVATLIATSCAAGAGLTVIAALAGADTLALLALSISGLAGTQIILSFAVRSTRPGHLLLPWIDGLVIFLILPIVAMLAIDNGIVGPGAVVAVFIALTVATAMAALAVLGMEAQGAAGQLWLNGRQGLNLAIYALFGTWVAVCGRILMAALSPGDVAPYGVAFRLAGLALVLPQLVVVGLWRHLYTCSARRADTIIAATLAGTAAIAMLVLWGATRFVGEFPLEALDDHGRAACLALLPIVTVQIFVWSAHMMLQPRINQAGVAGAAIVPMMAISLGGAATLFLATTRDTSGTMIAWMITAYCAAYFAGAWLVLFRKGAVLARTLAVVLIGGGCLVLTALL